MNLYALANNSSEELIGLLDNSFTGNNEQTNDIASLNKLSHGFDEETHRHSYVSHTREFIIRKIKNTGTTTSAGEDNNYSTHQEKMLTPVIVKKKAYVAAKASSSLNELTLETQGRLINSNRKLVQSQVPKLLVAQIQSLQLQSIQNSDPKAGNSTGGIQSSVIDLNNTNDTPKVNRQPSGDARLVSIALSKNTLINNKEYTHRETIVDNKKAISQPANSPKNIIPSKNTGSNQSTNFRIAGNKFNKILSQNREKRMQNKIFIQNQILNKNGNPIKTKPCQICLEDVNMMDIKSKTLPECKGVYHIECLKEYVLIAIQERNVPVKCPDEKCKQILHDETMRTFLNRAEMKFYEKQKLKATALANPGSYVFCPTPDCEYIFKIIDKTKIPKPRQCLDCHKMICLSCRALFHIGLTCTEYQSYKPEDYEAANNMKKLNWRKCLKCRFWIEKNNGCNHMVCICKNQFCFVCGKKWKTCKCVADEQAPVIVEVGQQVIVVENANINLVNEPFIDAEQEQVDIEQEQIDFEQQQTDMIVGLFNDLQRLHQEEILLTELAERELEKKWQERVRKEQERMLAEEEKERAQLARHVSMLEKWKVRHQYTYL